jgi:hypothetical protein
MIRDRKARLAFAVAMGAAGVAAAVLVVSAGAHTPAKFEFPKGGNTTLLSTVDGVHEIYIPSWGPLVCEKADFVGTVSGASATSVVVRPSYSECQLLGEEAQVLLNACVYEFKADGGFEIATLSGENCLKNNMEITTKAGCKVYIREQNPLSGIGYTNINNNEEITFSMTITKLEGFRWECNPTGNFSTGEYKSGNTILRGVEDNATKGKLPIKWVATVP